MAKVITFSRQFPKGHPKEGQPTYFVEKFWNSMPDIDFEKAGELNSNKVTESVFDDFLKTLKPIKEGKYHTIRVGKRFKEGELFSPRVWSEKPYTSPQIIIAPDVKIIKIYDISFYQKDELLKINDSVYYPTGYNEMVELLAKNDGLSVEDFKSWFTKPFDGQIICWQDCGY